MKEAKNSNIHCHDEKSCSHFYYYSTPIPEADITSGAEKQGDCPFYCTVRPIAVAIILTSSIRWAKS